MEETTTFIFWLAVLIEVIVFIKLIRNKDAVGGIVNLFP